MSREPFEVNDIFVTRVYNAMWAVGWIESYDEINRMFRGEWNYSTKATNRARGTISPDTTKEFLIRPERDFKCIESS